MSSGTNSQSCATKESFGEVSQVPLALTLGYDAIALPKKIVRVLIYRKPRGRRSDRMTLWGLEI